MRSVMGCLVAALLFLSAAHDSSGLIFSLDQNDLPAAGQAVTVWGDFNAMGAPLVEEFNGVKWMRNTYTPSTGLRHVNSPFTEAIWIDGATIVTAVKPVRSAEGGEPWNSIVDIFYDQLCIGISNQTGRVKVKVTDDIGIQNHLWTAPEETAIPDGEAGVLSMTVSNTGYFTVYWMGADGFERLIGEGQGLTDGYFQLTPGAFGRGFANYINVGRNNPDGWTTYNGYIGNTYVYGSMLDEWDRFDLVEQTFADMGLVLDTPPDAPAEIIYPATSSSGQFQVSWSVAANALNYRLERSADDGASWTEIYFGAETERVEEVGAGTYVYRVRAENPLGESDWTTGDHGIVVTEELPYIPASITYPAGSATGWFTVSWPTTLRAESYRLERTSDAGATWSEVYAGTALQFLDQALSGTYRYRVRGENTAGAGEWRTGTQNLVVTLNALATWRVESFDEPWNESVAGTTADANEDGYDNFTNFALRGDPLVDDGAEIEPRMVWDADLNEAVFTFRVRAAGGTYSAVTGGYYITGVAYYVEAAEEPEAAQWSRMSLTVDNTQIIEGPEGPMARVQVSTAINGEAKGFARLIIRNTN